MWDRACFSPSVQVRAHGASEPFCKDTRCQTAHETAVSVCRWFLPPAWYWKQLFFYHVIDRCMLCTQKDSQYVQLEPQKILAFLSWCSSIILSASLALLGSPPASIKALVFWAQSSISFISKLNFCNWYEAASFSFLPHKVQFSIIWHRIIQLPLPPICRGKYLNRSQLN